MSYRACECKTPEAEHPPDTTRYINRCTCGGLYVFCIRCLGPLHDGKEHGLGKCEMHPRSIASG